MTPSTIQKNQIRSGDARAFDRLYADLGPRVLGYLLRLTGGCRADAEDLLQDTFLAAYAGRDSFGGKSQPLAWLLGIARRRWRDGIRTPRPTHLVLEGDDGKELAVEGHADRVAGSAALEWALARLKPEEREVLLLVAVQGLSYREAAQVLDQPVGTLKWRVHVATGRLRELLGEGKEDESGPETTRTAAAAAGASGG